MPKLVLLPGMDGTGELFRDFVEALPEIDARTIRYPTDRVLSYSELIPYVNSAIPTTEPFVLLAESFSSPLAIRIAATHPPNLKGLIICAGFASSPVRGLLRSLLLCAAPLLFGLPLPRFAARLLLVGSNASSSLLAAVVNAVSSVQPDVLAARLRAVLTCDARPELGTVAVPVMYVRAKQDHLVKASSLNEIRRIKPDLAVASIAGPHLILQREPQQTAEIITTFVKRLASPCDPSATAATFELRSS